MKKIDPKDYEIRVRYSRSPGDLCYIASALDMPNIQADGDTPEEAVREARIAIELNLEVLAEDGIAPPSPGSAAAASFAAMGGRATSARKRKAAAANGRKGGRPKGSRKRVAIA
jgi:predicted RNase H-like HicB family nuclease